MNEYKLAIFIYTWDEKSYMNLFCGVVIDAKGDGDRAGIWEGKMLLT